MKILRHFIFFTAGFLLTFLLGCKPSLNNSDPAVRLAAVQQLTDQAALAKVAMEDKDTSVRNEAFRKLTDQGLLAKIAIEATDPSARYDAVDLLTDQAVIAKVAMEDKDEGVRSAAAIRLTDQALLAKVALEAKDSQARYDAVATLTDQAVLAKIVMQDKDEPVRSEAFRELTDQGLLAKIAVESADADLRNQAVKQLNDQPVLVKIAMEDKDADVRQSAIANLSPETRQTAINEWNEPGIDFGRLAGNLSVPTSDAIEAMARMRLLLANPIITSRMPNTTLIVSLAPTSADYFGGTMPGEKVIFSLSQDSKISAIQSWETTFPTETASLAFERADVDLSAMMAEFFSAAGLSPEDLGKLSQSEIPEVREAAKQRLDQLRAGQP